MIDSRTFLLGDDAVAIHPKDKNVRHEIARALRSTGDWIDVVPGKEIVAAQFDPLFVSPGEAKERIETWLGNFDGVTGEPGTPIDLHLDVSGQNAPDLYDLAKQNGLSPEVFLEKVFRSELVVDMLGFTPGFAYVEGVDPALTAERLSVPRQRVFAGSVGILNGQLGLYGLEGPGGWPIIGRLTEKLFDPERENAFLLQEGRLIRLKLADC